MEIGSRRRRLGGSGEGTFGENVAGYYSYRALTGKDSDLFNDTP